MMLPFGKFKGQQISETPTHWLRWAYKTCDLDESLKEAIRRELEKRKIRLLEPSEVAEILTEIEEELVELISGDMEIDHTEAGVITDHIMLVFDEFRQKHKI